ncbi:thiamine diphosphate-binding protein [Yarrowia lipolytica]|uniref:YALI0D06930p n=2 Tax=Yarrowia lipolytica TaxID=4952 RepID=Q6CA04_YARLI|nr:YALI0D06930p [Yarrowia lipolytica CLIB122]AOW03697.1 hypothetical protein YALI1_D08884g [Yarrowia lipolytica]KAB8284386.1 thiamine diphosphate-binding protein [Yarrowia lipolytica]KAE8172638.1 thiamine diphosphate-binding protein [Yarrowia lipolytica]KAJ8054700.1 thiamine diphosphate-binding protein [Yarrowia lipolytica]QNP98540.1 Pyruvate decarboxylase isozyme 3 [Yarrowia lipolytica]|eukprot:XP_502508.1 YALI0D06930p [Yarrowia lipolytica CLIB122]
MTATSATASTKKDGNVHLGEYLFSRIKQLGIDNILGVPGDFNLHLLDYIYRVPDLNWVGCCNELNAAYAADGYGRVKHLPGVLVTTYGVGELSALNGVSGAFAEQAPLLHIVGTTGRPIQEESWLVHHVLPKENSLQEPDHLVYQGMSEKVRCCSAFLNDKETAAAEIDRVLTTICQKSLPGYLFIPVDMTWQPLDAARLDSKLDYSVKNEDPKLENEIVDSILSEIYASKNATVFADVLTARHRATDLVRELAKKTNFPNYTSPLGKGILNENEDRFVGVYNGQLSLEGVAKSIEASDCVLFTGPLLSDSNTGGFSHNLKDENTIYLSPDYVKVKGKLYEGVHFFPVLKKVVEQLDVEKISAESKTAAMPTISPPPVIDSPLPISQTFLVDSMSKMMRPDDLLIVETGTFQFACSDVKFNTNNSLLTQIFYSCIGFTLPATLGAALAKREDAAAKNDKGRVILVEGDGSAQMTIQELGTMVRQGLNPIIFLLNNDGYSIERAIHGPEQSYNDICPKWKWTKLLEAFGGTEGVDSFSTTVKTREELEALIGDEKFMNSDKAQLVEVIMDVNDYPWRLNEQIKLMGGKNMKVFAEYQKKNP